MKEKDFFKDFKRQYPLSKTLRFELRPMGETLANIKEKGLLAQDHEKSLKYEKAKIIIDEYHRGFIERALSGVFIDIEDLEEYKAMYEKIKKDKSDKTKKAFQKKQADLRKKIVRIIKGTDGFKNLFSKELIQQDLVEWLEQNKEKREDGENDVLIIKHFKQWVTYFKGFHENRKNVYTDADHSTAIAYRIVHDNLPKFLDNVQNYKALKEKYDTLSFEKVREDMAEELGEISIDKVFSLDYFNQCLSQSGIDVYNTILGGKSEEKGKKKQGVNECINLYRQKHRIKPKEAPIMRELYKQILSEKEHHSFLPEAFKDDKQVLDSIRDYYNEHYLKYKVKEGEVRPLSGYLKKMLQGFKDESFDLQKVYLKNNLDLTHISNVIFGEWYAINDALALYAEKKFPQKGKKITKKEEEAREKWTKSPYFSIAELEEIIKHYLESKSDEYKGRDISQTPIIDYLVKMEKTIKIFEKGETKEKSIHVLDYVDETYKACVEVLNKQREEGERKLMNDNSKGDVEKMKHFLDAVKELLHFIKPLLVKATKGEDAMDKDDGFYTKFETVYEHLEKIIPLYNKVRNYVTQKAYSIEKYKLNFENTTLLDGWDVNKERDNTAILFMKDGLYYVGIMDKNHNTLFKDIGKQESASGQYYQKIHYKLLPGANKMLPKVFISAKKNVDFYRPSAELLENYKNETHKKGDNFNIDHCHALIDYFKACIEKHPDWKNFDFTFSPTRAYEDLSGFYREVEQQGYKITFSDIAEEYIQQAVKEKKLYLFQIYNKDFSAKSRGTENLHTIYWKALFDERNLSDVVFKLNGEAEVFFRPASIKYNQEIWEQGHHNNEPKKKQPYPIIKDRRYAQDKFQFHVPITLNFKAVEPPKFNDKTNRFLQHNPEIKILGIDRGERHLVYYSLINQRGEIEKQGHFDKFGETDFQKKLDDRDKERKKAREEWGTIEGIKNLKEGYLSQVVHEIVKIMLEEKAIVVFEDLNFGFKRGRFKVEKQIYQKLEKMLIDKLNYVFIKQNDDRNIERALFEACQLSRKFESFQKMGKQMGCIFYVPAHYTSKICPATGFVNLLYPKYESIEKAQQFFAAFDSIRYNVGERYFEFEFDYSNFTSKAEGSKTHWVLCSGGGRLARKRNKKSGHWEIIPIYPTDKIKTLLEERGIGFENGEELKNAIVSVNDADFLKEMTYQLRLVLQMRNSKTDTNESGTDEDYIISPVKDENGRFFDSRKAGEKMPKDADANGAYHIGLKGLWALRQLDDWDGKSKVNLAISNKEWFKFAQEKTFRKK